jgi:hypothetical protein
MAKVLIRFYEELNDFLPPGKRKRDFELSLKRKEALHEILERLGVPQALVDLMLVNGRSAALDEVVKNGDRISAYPVFERFNIKGVSRVREKPLRKLSFIVGKDLAALAESLTALGLDVCFHEDLGGEEILRAVKEERRILLTRRKKAVTPEGLDRMVVLKSGCLDRQIKQVIDALDLGVNRKQERAHGGNERRAPSKE